jgi:hypothetical protein
MDGRPGLAAAALSALSLGGALWTLAGGPPLAAGALAVGGGVIAAGIAGALWLASPRGTRPPWAALAGGLAGIAGAVIFLGWAVGLA